MFFSDVVRDEAQFRVHFVKKMKKKISGVLTRPRRCVLSNALLQPLELLLIYYKATAQ